MKKLNFILLIFIFMILTSCSSSLNKVDQTMLVGFVIEVFGESTVPSTGPYTIIYAEAEHYVLGENDHIIEAGPTKDLVAHDRFIIKEIFYNGDDIIGVSTEFSMLSENNYIIVKEIYLNDVGIPEVADRGMRFINGSGFSKSVEIDNEKGYKFSVKMITVEQLTQYKLIEYNVNHDKVKETTIELNDEVDPTIELTLHEGTTEYQLIQYYKTDNENVKLIRSIYTKAELIDGKMSFKHPSSLSNQVGSTEYVL